MARQVKVEAVKAGEVIEIAQIPDKRRGQVEVKVACDNKNDGHWYCVTHHEPFPNQFMKDVHIKEGEHRLVWICHQHGAEEP